MKIVIDTSVFIAGLLSQKGASAEILQLLNSGVFTLVISHPIFEEYKEILLSNKIKKLHNKSEVEVLSLLNKLYSQSIVVEHKSLFKNIVKHDVEDEMFLETAIEGDVQYLISLDKKHMLPIKGYQGIKIISPSVFLDIVRQTFNNDFYKAR